MMETLKKNIAMPTPLCSSVYNLHKIVQLQPANDTAAVPWSTSGIAALKNPLRARDTAITKKQRQKSKTRNEDI